MSKKFYKILGLTDTASDIEIIEAYRELALKYHPMNKSSGNLSYFHKLSEAYEVLSDPKLRRNYDRFEELVFKEGVPQDSGINNNFVAGYSYRGDGFEIFQRFFGSSNPFFSDFSESFGLKKFVERMPERKQSIIVSDLIVEVHCTLEELFHGCQKTVSFQRNLVNADGSFRTEPGEKVIEILPGSEETNPIVFEAEGHEGLNRVKTDLKVKIVEIKHEVFIRKGNDLIMIKKIPLVHAIAADALQVVWGI